MADSFVRYVCWCKQILVPIAYFLVLINIFPRIFYIEIHVEMPSKSVGKGRSGCGLSNPRIRVFHGSFKGVYTQSPQAFCAFGGFLPPNREDGACFCLKFCQILWSVWRYVESLSNIFTRQEAKLPQHQPSVSFNPFPTCTHFLGARFIMCEHLTPTNWNRWQISNNDIF